tara:strand:- start:1494 stop:1898 length:405 start_codon:yes stop_codon:yes gene_type:complete
MTRPLTVNYTARLSRLLDMWARWVHTGQVVKAKSILQKIMDGDSFARSGGGSSPMIDCVELNIEAALMRLAVTNASAVAVCRVEYGASFLPNLPIDAKRDARALRMGMSLRTYNRRLKEARDYLETTLLNTGDL